MRHRAAAHPARQPGRWLVGAGARGGLHRPQRLGALIGLASGDLPYSERRVGLLERPEELSRARARVAGGASLVDLAPCLRGREALLFGTCPIPAREWPEGQAWSI
jgi:hypothetical protein